MNINTENTMTWQPMSTAPKNGDTFLAIRRWESFPEVTFWGLGRKPGWRIASNLINLSEEMNIAVRDEDFTHWMPIPKLPCPTGI
jgi:hypothetical protein